MRIFFPAGLDFLLYSISLYRVRAIKLPEGIALFFVRNWSFPAFKEFLWAHFEGSM
jgi:hypothetical protein